MSISYEKEQREAAKAKGWPLVSIDAGGPSFQGPVPPEDREELMQYLLGFLRRRRDQLKAGGTGGAAQ